MNIHQTQGYFPDYDLKCFTDGDAGEQQVIQYLQQAAGGNHFTIEVKTDRKAAQTGNIYIELECRGKPSGLLATKATWFTIVTDNGDTIRSYKAKPFREFVLAQANRAHQQDDLRLDNCRLTGTSRDPKRPTVGLIYSTDWIDADYRAFNTKTWY